MPIEHIFLDDGGVMNDNALRAPQWQRLVGEFFPSRLGGTPEAWSRANLEAFWPAIGRWQTRIDNWDPSHDNLESLQRDYELDWLRSMAALAGVATPANDEDCSQLAREASLFVITRVRSAYPGAAAAVRELSPRYDLCTASGEASHELAAYLTGMDLDGVFRHLYGPDLVNYPKAGPAYYQRVFAHALINPANSLVVDDSPRALAWARTAGAGQVALVGPATAAPEGSPIIPSLAALPALLDNGVIIGL